MRKALEGATATVNSTLWWVSVENGLRIGNGLSLWPTAALEPWLRHLLDG